jgi:hypothetical protein
MIAAHDVHGDADVPSYDNPITGMGGRGVRVRIWIAVHERSRKGWGDLSAPGAGPRREQAGGGG